MNLQAALIDLASLLSFGIACGVVFGTLLLVEPDRTQSHRGLIAFCISLMIWSALYLTGSLRGIRLESQQETLWQLFGTVIGLTVVTYALAASPYFREEDRLARRVVTLMPVALLIGLIVIWTGGVFTPAFGLQPLGYIGLAALIFSAVFVLWAVLTSTHPRAPTLRLPSLLVVGGVAAQLIDETRIFPVGLMLTAGAALLFGWSVLRYQVLRPIQNLTEEVRVANRDLRQLVTDLATERGRMAELSSQLAASRQFGQYKSDFLNLLGHRLRTPLNSIVGYSELLESGVYGILNDKQQDRMNKIHRNSAVLLAVISDMLDLNLIDAGQLALQLRLMSMSGLIQNALNIIEVERAEKGIDIHFQPDDSLPAVLADEIWFPKAAAQLLRYAISRDVQAIEVRARPLLVRNGTGGDFQLPLMGWLSDGTWALMDIAFPEVTLSPEAQAQFFETFADAPDQDEQSSTGLGLTIAKKLIELHEGTLWVKSQPDQGTILYIALRASGTRGG
ncbi:MAG: HAMP domain-containing sensor histidine kinase [bacterium]|nr:HAMP domain-containing sensor histidine kinase [bacterium]